VKAIDTHRDGEERVSVEEKTTTLSLLGRAGATPVISFRMAASVVVLREAEIRALLDPASCVAAVEQAFSAYAAGAAELPGVIHLDVPEEKAEIHIKAGYLHGGPGYAVKVASGFPGNPDRGLPANDGLVMVFDAQTGALAALLLDRGYVTDLRTAAAGAVAAKYLARASIDTVSVVGTGVQARLQVQLLATVRSFRSVRVWGRRREAAERCVADLAQTEALPPGVNLTVVDTTEVAVRGADVVYTVTARDRKSVV
jgi:ornithine cyclodeaminase